MRKDVDIQRLSVEIFEYCFVNITAFFPILELLAPVVSLVFGNCHPMKYPQMQYCGNFYRLYASVENIRTQITPFVGNCKPPKICLWKDFNFYHVCILSQ